MTYNRSLRIGRVGRVWLVAVFLTAVGLSYLGSAAPDRGSHAVEVPEAPVEAATAPVGEARLAASGRRSPKNLPPGDAPHGVIFRVTVRSATDGSFVPGSSVSVCLVEGDSERGLDEADEPPLGTGTTDANGEAVVALEAGNAAAYVAVAARASGFGSTSLIREVAAEGAAEDVSISLPAEQTIEGRVHDRNGAPIAGVHVIARPASSRRPLSWLAASAPADVRNGNAVSDAQGAFRIVGLSAGTFRLSVEDDWWRQTTPTVGRRHDIVVAGTTDASIEVEGVRFFRIRLKNRDGGGAPAGAFRMFGVAATDGVVPQSFLADIPLLRDGASIPTGPYRRLPGEGAAILGVVALKEGTAVPDKASIVLQPDGFEAAYATVRLWPVSALSDSSAVDDVFLQPTPGLLTGTVVVRDDRNTSSHWRPPARTLQVFPAGTDFENRTSRIVREASSFIGRPGERDTWRFDGVPAGPHRLRLLDGLSTSDVIDVDVRSGEETDVNITWPPTSGITVVVRDSTGRRITPESVSVAPERSVSSTAGNEWLGRRVRSSDGRYQDTMQVLAPGTYLVGARAHGFFPATATVHVEPGRVTRATLILASGEAR